MTLLGAAPVVVARAIGSKSRRTSEWPRKRRSIIGSRRGEE